MVKQTVNNLTAIDFDPVFISDAQERHHDDWPIDVRVHNILDGPVDGRFDAAYSIDVIEHIEKEDEDTYLTNILASLDDDGVLIVGTPTLESQTYASPRSVEGHVNCMSAPDLKTLLELHFKSVNVFSMNDEVIHTGFHKMAHYLFAVCSHRRL